MGRGLVYVSSLGNGHTSFLHRVVVINKLLMYDYWDFEYFQILETKTLNNKIKSGTIFVHGVTVILIAWEICWKLNDLQVVL